MKNNVYVCAADKVREMKAQEQLEISKSEIVEHIMAHSNIHEVEREELEQIAVNLLVAVALNQNNCYSLKRGSGDYLNVELCERLEALMLVEHNLSKDLEAKLKAIRKIRALQNGILSGQIDFDELEVGYG